MTERSEQEHIFIGDIHGQAATLVALLDQLGWRRRGGRLRGPGGSRLVFVGDLIDRGPHNRRTVETVRQLVEQGEAICMLGNHEYNAVQFHTEDPDHPGQYLRAHSKKHLNQHEAVLKEFANDSSGLREIIAWFRTLPVAAVGPNWRCIHACWDPAQLAHLAHENGTWRLAGDRWTAAARPDAPEYNAIEVLTKGPEHPIPGGFHYPDTEGNPRYNARIRWWQPNPRTVGEAMLLARRGS